MINLHYFGGGWLGWGGVAGGIETNANSVQLQLQLPTGAEVGKKLGFGLAQS